MPRMLSLTNLLPPPPRPTALTGPPAGDENATDSFPLPPHPTKVRYAPSERPPVAEPGGAPGSFGGRQPTPTFESRATAADFQFHPKDSKGVGRGNGGEDANGEARRDRSPSSAAELDAAEAFRAPYPPQTVTPREEGEAAAEQSRTEPSSPSASPKGHKRKASDPASSIFESKEQTNNIRSGFLPPPHAPQGNRTEPATTTATTTVATPRYASSTIDVSAKASTAPGPMTLTNDNFNSTTKQKSKSSTATTPRGLPTDANVIRGVPSSSSSASLGMNSFGRQASKSSSWEEQQQQHWQQYPARGTEHSDRARYYPHPYYHMPYGAFYPPYPPPTPLPQQYQQHYRHHYPPYSPDRIEDQRRNSPQDKNYDYAYGHASKQQYPHDPCTAHPQDLQNYQSPSSPSGHPRHAAHETSKSSLQRDFLPPSSDLPSHPHQQAKRSRTDKVLRSVHHPYSHPAPGRYERFPPPPSLPHSAGAYGRPYGAPSAVNPPNAADANSGRPANVTTLTPSLNTKKKDQHTTGVPLLPVYAYTTDHQDKSWDEMVDLFKAFVEKHGHGDVESTDPVQIPRSESDGGMYFTTKLKKEEYDSATDKRVKKEEAKECDKIKDDESKENVDDSNKADNALSKDGSEDDDDYLLLRSWVREVRWVFRANGGEDDKAAAQNKKLTSFAINAKTKLVKRCDSETVTPERADQLTKLNFPWKRERSTWQKWLDDLTHYKAKNDGCANVPLKYVDYPSLGNFVNRQRTEYRKLMQGKSSSMTLNKMRDLEAVGFIWSIRDGGHTSWESRLMELKQYQQMTGNSNVPKCYPPNPSLGYWVNEQRFQYRRLMNGKSSYMNQSKIDSLNAIGFVWSLRESKRPWNDWIEELRKYKAEHGNVDVPLKYEKNVPLGAFVNNQRSEYRKLKRGDPSSMTEEKIRDLESLGFQWSVRDSRIPWAARLKELTEYKEKFGDCDVPLEWSENQALASWVEKQRQQYKLLGRANCQLTRDRVKLLNDLGFDWKDTTTTN
mmetsp:Transcript_6594/g.12541  ORF Transcript_6594/g.12541 Transcript_6594/m.12541 type:complete len:1008 (-) Transcript_6594:383-3406(-)